ncbi:MAG TPA: ATP phosphoribosyltransferase [Dehalococcoidia bacterium]|nr:ATP phosphoribosyltransferase [Dehalococcoidia bacterium]
MQIKLALPKGPLQDRTAVLLKEAGFAVGDYDQGSRSYRPQCEASPGLFVKVFHEKDIAIQVAIGNYDLGICRFDWVEELLVKYHSDAVVKVQALGYGKRNLYAVAADSSEVGSLQELKSRSESLRIVTEYPNLAESFALTQRLRKFQIFPVWGAAGAYLPENAELAIMTGASSSVLREQGLVPVATILGGGAYLVANRNSLESKDLSRILSALSAAEVVATDVEEAVKIGAGSGTRRQIEGEFGIYLALPDGHQQRHTAGFLKKAGLGIRGYSVGRPTTRPRIGLDGVAVKVVRPQDMPLQVANGSFDLAITGRDWLQDHRFRFPSSPVEEVLELGFGWVRIVAVVSQDLPVSSTKDLRRLGRDSALRLASEYVNIADKYALDNHLVPYKLIPTWGATEAFLPEDADVLIENTETGSTIAKHKLKIIDTLFESSACLIGNTEAMRRRDKREKISHVIEAMRRGVEARPVS